MDNMFWLLLVLQFSVFIGLVVVLRFFSYRNLKGALNRLNTLHEENLIKEDELKQELERGKAERLAEVEKGKVEAKNIIETTKKEMDVLKIKLEEDAKQQAEQQATAIIQRAEHDAEKFKQNVLAEIAKQALDLSTQMIKYTLSSQGKENLQHQFIDEIIEEIKALPKEKFTVTTDKVKIISAFPLTDGERHNLKTILLEKLDLAVNLEEQIDPGLVTGLVLEIGALIIDGGLKNRLSRAMAYLKADRS